MKTVKKVLTSLLSLVILLCGIPVMSANAAASDYVTVTKTVNPGSITTEQEATVTLGIKGSPPVNVVMPNDVILIIDKSGSMRPEYNNGEDKITAAKNAAMGFIDLMDLTKHRVGVVDFSSSDLISSFPLTADGQAAKDYISGIQANGSTATGDAIQAAINLLENHRPEAQPVIVIMTDGEANVPSVSPYDYAKDKAQAAKDAGIVFYTIALLRSTDNPDTSGPNILLKEMATTAAHHHFVLGSTGLAEIYAAIVKEIGLASAYDVVVTDTVSPDFEIVPDSYNNNIPKPTVQGNTLTWSFLELKNQELQFTYKIRPKDPNKVGFLNVTDTSTSKIIYKDYAGAERSKAIPSAGLKVTYPSPIITSIVNDTGAPVGGETVTINGDKFRPGLTVKFGYQYATNVQFIDSTKVTAVVPAYNAVGKVTVTLINDDNQSATGDYTYSAEPIVTSITPKEGPIEGGTIVVFNGNFFGEGLTVKFGDQDAPIYMHSSQTYLKVTSPASSTAGPVDVQIINKDGKSLTIPGGFTYIAPPPNLLNISKISPSQGPMAGGTVVYIDGNKFAQDTKVFFGSTEVPITTFYTTNRVKVVAPASATSGLVDVTVTNADGETFTYKEGFSYDAPPVQLPPAITNISPNTGELAGGEVVYIDGSSFVNGLKVYFGTSEAPVLSFYSANRIKVQAPASTTPGSVSVRIVNPDNQEVTLANGYTYLTPPPPQAPTVTRLTANNGAMAGGEYIYIDGTGFAPGLKIYFGTNEAQLVTYYSALRLKVKAPASTVSGAVDVTVVNLDGQSGTLPGGYTYNAPPAVPAPVISAITPNKGLTSGGETITITGSGFQNGATVTVGGNTVGLLTFTSSTKVTIKAPASVTVGTADVTITNPDSQSFTLSGGYTYEAPTPAITKLTPANGPMAGGTVIYMDGVNFDPDMVITVNGTQVPITTYYSSNRVKFSSPSSAVSGPVELRVTLPNGNFGTSTFTYDAPPPVLPPVLTKLSLTSGPVAGGTTVYIDGSGFDPNMKVNFGSNQAQILTYYSSYRIKVRVPAGTSVGLVNVQIVNPDGQVSNILQYQYK